MNQSNKTSKQDADALLAELKAEAKQKQKKKAETLDTDALIAQLTEETRAEVAAERQHAAPAEEDAVSEEVTESAEETAIPEAESAVEEQVLAALARLTQPKAMSRTAAEEQFDALTEMGRVTVRRLNRKAHRCWKKEASAEQARLMSERTGRTAAKWNVAVCLGIFFSVAVGMLVLERPTVSEIENRNLATMPEWSVDAYLSGEYTGGVAEYYNDTVPFRSTFKAITQSIRKHMGLNDKAILHITAPSTAEEPSQTETTTPEEAVTTTQRTELGIEVTTTKATTTVTEPAEEEAQGGEISNNILIVDKRGIMLFGGYEKMGEPYARYLNHYKQDLPDVNMYSMVVPTVCSYYTPEEYRHLITSEKANIDYINQCLDGVIPVDVYTALEQHKDEPIYMRTDHHWAGLGAFYAAEAFSAEARVPFAGIEQYDKHVKEGYVGTLYGYSNDIVLKENPEDFIWYTPHREFSTTFYNSAMQSGYTGSFYANIDNLARVSWYLVYMMGDDKIVQVDTDVHNGRTLCVMKDSYGNALIPWLTSSFERIYVIDMRYFKLNSVRFMKEHGVTDLLFCMNSFSANSGNAKKMEDIRLQ